MEKEYDFTFFEKPVKKTKAQYIWDCDFLRRKKEEKAKLKNGLENLYTAEPIPRKTGWRRLEDLDVYMIRGVIVMHVAQGLLMGLVAACVAGTYLGNKVATAFIPDIAANKEKVVVIQGSLAKSIKTKAEIVTVTKNGKENKYQAFDNITVAKDGKELLYKSFEPIK